MTAIRLSSKVWLVGSADGPAFTDTYDGNQYLVWDGQQGVLIDCGTGRGVEKWFDNVVSVTGGLEKTPTVLLTHYHADHAGAASAAVQAGLTVLGSPATAAALRTGDEQITSVARARLAGVYPTDYRLNATPDVSIVPASLCISSTINVRALCAPGHCDGHLVFALTEREGVALFTGDTIFREGKVSIQAIPDCRLSDYADTIKRLARQRVTALYPGHGSEELDPDAAAGSMRLAADSFSRLVPPPNLLQ